MSLRNVNLNLVPVLRALLREGNVSAAAKAVGLSQPATSAALSRLRGVIGDPLLVRVGSSMQLTPRAKQIAQMLEPLCEGLEEVFEEPRFDPAQARRVFVLCVPDYVGLLLGERLLERISVAAPNITIRFVDAPAAMQSALVTGELDGVITRWVEGVDESLSVLRGYFDRMVGLVSQDHPLAKLGQPRLSDLKRYPQVRHQRNSIRGSVLRFWLDLPGRTPIVSAHFIYPAILMLNSNAFALAPKSVADHLTSILPLASFELPLRGVEFEACMLWGPILDGDPAHQWLRELMDEAMRSHLSA